MIHDDGRQGKTQIIPDVNVQRTVPSTSVIHKSAGPRAVCQTRRKHAQQVLANVRVNHKRHDPVPMGQPSESQSFTVPNPRQGISILSLHLHDIPGARQQGC